MLQADTCKASIRQQVLCTCWQALRAAAAAHLVAGGSCRPCACCEPRGYGVGEGDGRSAQHQVACSMGQA